MSSKGPLRRVWYLPNHRKFSSEPAAASPDIVVKVLRKLASVVSGAFTTMLNPNGFSRESGFMIGIGEFIVFVGW